MEPLGRGYVFPPGGGGVVSGAGSGFGESKDLPVAIGVFAGAGGVVG